MTLISIWLQLSTALTMTLSKKYQSFAIGDVHMCKFT